MAAAVGPAVAAQVAVRAGPGAAGRAGLAIGTRAGRDGRPRAGLRPVAPALGLVVHDAAVEAATAGAAPPSPVLERRGLTASAPAEASAAAHESPEVFGSGRLGGWPDGSACRREPGP